MQHRTANSKGNLEHVVHVCEVVSWLLTDNSNREMCLCARNYWMKSKEVRTSSQWSVKHETWVHWYDPKNQTAHPLNIWWKWGMPGCTSRACCYDQEEFVPPCQIINQHYCLKVLLYHTQQVYQKHPEQLRDPDWLKGVNAKGWCWNSRITADCPKHNPKKSASSSGRNARPVAYNWKGQQWPTNNSKHTLLLTPSGKFQAYLFYCGMTVRWLGLKVVSVTRMSGLTVELWQSTKK